MLDIDPSDIRAVAQDTSDDTDTVTVTLDVGADDKRTLYDTSLLANGPLGDSPTNRDPADSITPAVSSSYTVTFRDDRGYTGALEYRFQTSPLTTCTNIVSNNDSDTLSDDTDKLTNWVLFQFPGPNTSPLQFIDQLPHDTDRIDDSE